jgi:ribosome-associated translation inhibitor RaiA
MTDYKGWKIEVTFKAKLGNLELYDSSFESLQARIRKIELRKQQDECTHDERDHGICLDCGHEEDPGEAIDRAMDRLEDR